MFQWYLGVRFAITNLDQVAITLIDSKIRRKPAINIDDYEPSDALPLIYGKLILHLRSCFPKFNKANSLDF